MIYKNFKHTLYRYLKKLNKTVLLIYIFLYKES